MEWKPIEKEPKKVKKGFMRIYTFKPVAKEKGREYLNLKRFYGIGSRNFGFRECDAYMDIPLFSEETQ